MKLHALYLPGCPHEPTEKQAQGLRLPHTREILYGGAAGGGKSDWIVMAALQHIDVPQYSAIIFRRTFAQLAAPEDGLMARTQAWLQGHPKFRGSDMVAGMPTRWKYAGGGTLSFSHMQHEKDKYNHQGPSYQFVGFDELTQFSESQYLFLSGRMRRLSTQKALPLRMRSASNPGGEGHDWVRERFPVPRNGARRPMEGRHFIPAMLADNPHLDRDDYEKTLGQLHPFERAQLLDGNWDAAPPGARFKREWWRYLDASVVPTKPKRDVRFWDLAATAPKPGADPDWTVGTRMLYTGGDYIIAGVERGRWDAGDLDARILATAEQDGKSVPIRIEREGGSSGKIADEHFRRLLAGYDFRGVLATGSKVVRSNPLASDAHAGHVYLVRSDWNADWLREADMFPGGSHDDQIDSASGAHAAVTGRGGVSPADTIGVWAEPAKPNGDGATA